MRGQRSGGRRSVALLLLSAVALLAALPARASTRAMADAHASLGDSTLSWDQTTSLRGSGWGPGAQVQAVLYPNAVILATTTAGADGSIATSLTAPRVASGNKYVLQVQGVTDAGVFGGTQLPLTIVGPDPTLSISSKQLTWGAHPTVSGARWHPGTSVRLTLSPNTIELGSAPVDGDGSFSFGVTIPTRLTSSTNYQIVATGEGIDSLFHLEYVQVTIVGTRPTVHLSTNRTARGSSLQVTGELFFKGTSALITLLPGYEKLGSFPVGDDGTFSATVKIPKEAGGTDPHAILVTGTGTDGLFTYIPTLLTIGGEPPSGATKANAIGIDQNTPPPPGVDLNNTPGSIPVGRGSSGTPIAASWLLIALVVLLCGAAVAVIALTARRDVRRNLEVRRVRLARRLGLRKPGT